MSEKFDPNNPEHVMKKHGWSRKEFEKRMGIVAKHEGQLTPAGAESANACPKCGCEETMPTGDGNAIGLCGHVWQAKD